MEYAIETVNLVKRYPTSAPPIRGMIGPLVFLAVVSAVERALYYRAQS